jgi:hypothetical protein
MMKGECGRCGKVPGDDEAHLARVVVEGIKIPKKIEN